MLACASSAVHTCRAVACAIYAIEAAICVRCWFAGAAHTASGGAAILARSHLGLDQYEAIPAVGEDHRMAAGQATVAIKGGIVFVSLYMRDSEGLSEKKREILEAAAAFLASTAGHRFAKAIQR